MPSPLWCANERTVHQPPTDPLGGGILRKWRGQRLDPPSTPQTISKSMTRFSVYVPSDPYESVSVETWGEAQRMMAVLADEFTYAEIRKDGKILDDLQVL